MSHHTQEQSSTGVVKNYTFTTLLSFIMMFCLFILMSRCHGSYHPATSNHHTQQHSPSEQKDANHH